MSRSFRTLALSAALLALSTAPAMALSLGGMNPRPTISQPVVTALVALFGL